MRVLMILPTPNGRYIVDVRSKPPAPPFAKQYLADSEGQLRQVLLLDLGLSLALVETLVADKPTAEVDIP